MKLEPKVITGALNAQNKGACDWGWQGQVAHGCYSYVVIIDPKTVQVLQVLDKHKGTVVKVKWARENYQHDVGSPYSLRLASGDSVGSIIIWDVALGEAKTEFSDGNKPIQDMEWLPCQDASHDLLVALHPPYSLILWNANTGTRLWKKSYTEVLLSLSLDPFNYRNIAFLGQDCIVFIDDFSITKTPSSNGKKYYISSPSAGKSDSTPTGSLERKSSSSSSRNLAKRMTKMLVGDVKPSGTEDNIALNECLQLTYHHSCRHHIILLYAREILILDLEINQTVGLIPLERTGSPFLNVLPMQLRDVLFCLHDNGGISCRVRRKTNLQTVPAPEGSGAFDDSPPNVSYDVAYDLRCQSDSLRMTRHCRVSGIMCCPVTENSLALLLSDSRVIFWDIHTVDFQASTSHNNISPLYTPGNSAPPVANQNPDLKIASSSAVKLPITSSVPYPKLGLCDLIGQSQILSPDNDSALKGHGVVMKFLMTGLLNGISTPVTVIRMCPPLTTKNWNLYQPLLAVGNQLGTVQIIHLGSGQIDREYSLHTSAIRGIEWMSLRSFISFSYPKPGVSGLVKNEILLVDISSGKATPIRSHKDQESPIEMLRISHLKQYFIITFKEKPLELWDMKTMTMLREMGRNVPRATALEWSPSHSMKAMMKRLQMQMLHQQQQTETQQTGTSSTEEGNQTGTSAISQVDSLTTSSVSMSESSTCTSDTKPTTKLTVKEHFVYTDTEGTMYHFVVEGNVFTDASKIPPESGVGTITWVAWKGDYIAFGDGDGQLCLWDLKAKTSRINSTHRGWIKKIRFAPGRGNLKFMILYNDGVDVWDINEGKPELISSLKSPKEVAKVIDAEWSGSDRPVLVTIEGCLHMFDMNMKKSSCSITERHLPDDVFSPYLMPARASLLMKQHLQHQHWAPAPGYSLTLTGLRDDNHDLETIINKQLALIDSDLAAYLPHCRFGTAQRCLLTARLYGDESEVHFWTVALHYLRSERVQPMSKSGTQAFSAKGTGDMFVPPTPSYKEANDLVNLDSQDDIDEKSLLWQQFKDQPLEMCHDFLCDNQSFKKYQLDRLALHDSKRVTYEHTRTVVENYTMLGQTDRAVQLLLETEPDNDGYFIDCLRACLVASVRSSGASQSTIKLVATNLIANGKLIAGVQLLCLIDKAMDACRYLQTYGAWDLAVWLAKSSLNYSECEEVMKRWVDHLSSTKVNQKSTAVLVMLTLGNFLKVIEMLYGLRQFNRASCFIEAAMEFGLLEKNEESKSIIEAVFLEYARMLSNMGHKHAAVYYCQQAGVKGEQLLKEVEILFS